ncbi:MAG: hypothetical protein ACYC7F_05065, partial [Gemmatimonadaceae bacterium]
LLATDYADRHGLARMGQQLGFTAEWRAAPAGRAPEEVAVSEQLRVLRASVMKKAKVRTAEIGGAHG